MSAIDALIESGGSDIDRYDLVEIWNSMRQDVINGTLQVILSPPESFPVRNL